SAERDPYDDAEAGWMAMTSMRPHGHQDVAVGEMSAELLENLRPRCVRRRLRVRQAQAQPGRRGEQPRQTLELRRAQDAGFHDEPVGDDVGSDAVPGRAEG